MKNDPAFPVPTWINLDRDSTKYAPGVIESTDGLTKRELLAGLAMHAMTASPDLMVVVTAKDVKDGSYARRLASKAVEWADALLEELAK